ncbi:conserved hypothetical protein [Shewanella sediminis HAW-EB3]|uniref:Uncharacterized protein n=1 Tax=Shewanella sediminis (strain HAW-EB3) TaxID=425104 RepID=A8FVH9_SHESH|nr:hypothetical protein [Shewanella sediminis]ABV36852.1 conserved hypothetical protein [Shewanella sediminis HAW-EB3]
MNHQQAWVYHGEKPKAGRKLLLLEADELILAIPLIYRLIHPDEILLRKDWFLPELVEDKSKNSSQNNSQQSEKYILLVPQLQRVTQLRKELELLAEALQHLNMSLNAYFSDFGWRMVRKELSQLKKRQKKAHIELSKDIIIKLKHYMEREKFESFDQAIDNLLTEVNSGHEVEE